ncbi:TIGR01458 family HAD-type hydrolase [Nitratifractor sp.]
MQEIRGILFDIGGVLYVGDRPIEGAVELIARLQGRVKMRFLTNSTRRPPSAIYEKLRAFGFDVREEQLFTALAAARRIVERAGGRAVTILTEEAEKYFGPLHCIDTASPFVVVGDAGENFNYPRLNRAFRTLMKGAELIAAAENRYFLDSDGELSMDAGGFVRALEYAAAVEARVVGKPSRDFFLQALDSMGLEPPEALMVGDDIESDIAGAQRAGVRTALVRTGKFRPEDLERGVRPDWVLESVAELESIL